MAKEYLEKWQAVINTVTIGATSKEGGSRVEVIKAGGETTLPFLSQEGSMPNKPVIAWEVWDTRPTEWPAELAGYYQDVRNDPLDWAEKCVRTYGASLICVRLQGAHPDLGNKDADTEARFINNLVRRVGVPLIIVGCGDDGKDNQILPACSQASRGERVLIGSAVQDNYKTLTASALADGHNIIAESPIDINIAKQLNILISDMGMPLERIVINPTTGALGYGLEYSYSIMERSRLAGLCGDKVVASPFICFVGHEAWRAKEAKATKEEFPQWGPESERGPIWEAITVTALLQAGSDILVMRHPKAIEKVNKYIDSLMTDR